MNVKHFVLAVLFGLMVGIVGTVSIALGFYATVFEHQGSLYATYQGKIYRLIESDLPLERGRKKVDSKFMEWECSLYSASTARKYQRVGAN